MNPIWFFRNLINCWRHGQSYRDAVNRLAWIYSQKLPKHLRSFERVVGFCYPLPVGTVRFVVRANRGSDAFIFGEVFDHEYYRVRLGTPPSTILDLGANAGFTAVYFARTYPNALLACVEPVADNLRILTRNLELNGINAAVFPGAADAKDGRVIMELGVMDYGHKIALSPIEMKSGVEVEAFSVPTILRRLGWDRIGLLKVDIEGHERSLFAADCEWLNQVDNICIECHEGFGERDLKILAERFDFGMPRRLPGIWQMSRETRAE